ncbi:MAG TPA: hypothetical protein PK867_04420 [Pirellulales bacterium]|nr:hypothetical protein [Pirellulales bacterium]
MTDEVRRAITRLLTSTFHVQMLMENLGRDNRPDEAAIYMDFSGLAGYPC